MAHPKPFPLPAGYPSPEEVAKRLGLSKKADAKVKRLVERVLAEKPPKATGKPKAPAATPRTAAKK